MALIDMKLSKKEQKKRGGIEVAKTAEDSGPKYPWGLSINLEADSLRKLGIDIRKLSVGQKLRLTAEVEVERLSVSSDKDNSQQEMRLQITKMDLPGAPQKTGGGKVNKFMAIQNAGPGEGF